MDLSQVIISLSVLKHGVTEIKTDGKRENKGLLERLTAAQIQ